VTRRRAKIEGRGFSFFAFLFLLQLKKEKRNCRREHPQQAERKKVQGGDALAYYLALFGVNDLRGRFSAPHNL
jgi:hypothetical protein